MEIILDLSTINLKYRFISAHGEASNDVNEKVSLLSRVLSVYYKAHIYLSFSF
jgi:hypothetical protein